MNKYSVEYDEETRRHLVVEWDLPAKGVRTGKTVTEFLWESDAVGECELLNVGYEYEMSEIASCEWDPK